jgi:hypothetical protein
METAPVESISALYSAGVLPYATGETGGNEVGGIGSMARKTPAPTMVNAAAIPAIMAMGFMSSS